MDTIEKKEFIQRRMESNNEETPYLTLNDLYEIYDKCKLYSLIKIVKNEGEVIFNEEDNEEGDSNTKEGDIKVSMRGLQK